MSLNSEKLNKVSGYSLKDFARFFTGIDKQAILLFNRMIVGTQAIPYKIRNKDFSIEVAATTAFTLNIVFHNVLIEDGRHPLEIIMDNVRVERLAEGRYRLRFINMLKKEDPPKESSFVFDQVDAMVYLWNYNFYTQPLSESSDKLPWCLLDEPMKALLAKSQYLGRDCLNIYEKKILPAVQFLDVIFSVYLHEGTRIAYGKSNIYYDKEVLEAMHFNKTQMRAGIELMEQFGWLELKQKFLHMEEDKPAFFKGFIRQLTEREGKTLYTWLTSNLSAATSEYSRLKQVLPVYAGNHQLIRSCMDRMMADFGYEGAYPHYRKERKAAFIEISQVYERKYTYLNEKKKLELISFVESIVNGCLELAAIQGTILGRKKTDIYDAAMTAIDGCFSDQGRRRCHVEGVLTIDPDMTEEQVVNLTRDFILGLVK